MTRHTFTVGLDIGKQNDYTAAIVLRNTPTADKTQHDAVHIERWRGVDYPETVRRIQRLIETIKNPTRLPTPPHVELVVDEGGPGGPVVDMFRDVGLRPIGVMIHGGHATVRDGMTYRVPKRELVAHVQVCLQSGRFKIAPSLKHADTLVAELLAFRVEISSSGHDRYGNDVGATMWREQPHDDLVLAAAMALWRAESGPRPNKPEVLRQVVSW